MMVPLITINKIGKKKVFLYICLDLFAIQNGHFQHIFS